MRTLLVGVAILGVAACGDDVGYPFGALTQVSGASPYPAGCNGTQTGASYPGAEVEPSLAVDPTDPLHLVGAWQQDRWSNGGAAGIGAAVSRDGGETWTTSSPAFGRCAGGDYERATDPWVSIGPDGAVYLIALGFDATTDRSGVLVSRSDDGGDTWGAPAALIADDDPDVFSDKESLTADPAEPGRAYATWDRLTGLLDPTQPTGTGPTWLARATAGAWEPARVIYDPGVDAQTIGNVIVVLPDGALVDVFLRITDMSTDHASAALAAIRSTDHGDTWSDAVAIAPVAGWGAHDADGRWIRDGGGMPAVAADPGSGAIHVVWQDALGAAQDGIAIATSTDGGLTWSAPARVNQAPAASAITPAIAVGADGTIAVTHVDLRGGADAAVAWLVTSTDGGASWTEEALTGPFDLRVARIGDVDFLGDYQGLVAAGDAFVPFFAAPDASDTGPTDVFVRPAP